MITGEMKSKVDKIWDELREWTGQLCFKCVGNLKGEAKRARTEPCFLVPKAEISGNNYDLSINRYKEVVYEEVAYDDPKVILKRLAKLEGEITKGRAELEGLLK